LEAQQVAVSQQLRTELNAANLPLLEEQLTKIEKALDTVWDQLQHPEQASPGSDVRQRQQELDDALPKIDFREAWRDFTAIYDEHVNRREGGAALLLAPDFRTMCADLFVRRLYDWLQGEVGYNKVRRVPLGISDFSQLTPDLFLRRLGSDFNVAMDGADANSAAQVRAVTDKMCAVLERGHLLLIEAMIDVDLYHHENFLHWLLDLFWPSLRASLNAAAQERTLIKCLLVLAVDPPLPKSLPLRERYCLLRKFDPVQRPLARVPLAPWRQEEIEEWLVHHSGLAEHWAAPKLAATVHAIFVASRNGEPLRVKSELQKLFYQHWNPYTGGV
jgi:inactive STAND/Effector-associated domain 9